MRLERLTVALRLPKPHDLHMSLATGPNGEKLSRQIAARPVNSANPVAALDALRSAAVLGLQPVVTLVWRVRWCTPDLNPDVGLVRQRASPDLLLHANLARLPRGRRARFA